MYQEIEDALHDNNILYTKNIPLSQYTTWKVGGPGDIVVEVSDSHQLKEIGRVTHEYFVPLTIIGGGSNVLIHDAGLRGVVVINKSRNIDIIDHNEVVILDSDAEQYNIWIEPRHGEEGDEKFYTFSDLDYQEEGLKIPVLFDSGVQMPYAIAWSLKNNLTGLQWFAGIPGTIGGALYNNIHGGTKHFSDNFISAQVMIDGVVQTVDRTFFDFGYDQSVLRNRSDVVVLQVTLGLIHGDVEKAKAVAKEWTKRKRIQPKVSCGCVFQNISKEKKEEFGFPTPSVGYIVDKKLGWIGKRYGDAVISDQHANFIVNEGNATAFQILRLMRDISQEVKARYNIDLKPEINFLGFEKQELEGIL